MKKNASWFVGGYFKCSSGEDPGYPGGDDGVRREGCVRKREKAEMRETVCEIRPNVPPAHFAGYFVIKDAPAIETERGFMDYIQDMLRKA